MSTQRIKNIEKDFYEPAFAYLVENGFENTSVRDLCKALSLSPGSVYYWFENKDDIYISVVQYGTKTIADRLFEFAFRTMQNPKEFFDTFLRKVNEYIREFRLIFQVTASPVYGKMVRHKSMNFKFSYDKYISRLADILGCSNEKIAPIIYLIISVLSDYVLWEDYEASKMQMDYLYEIINKQFLPAE